MAISKPSWLRSWLSKLNWDIFTWKVYIGDAIENAVDWAVGWINWGIDQATLAYNKAWDAWYKAVEVFNDLRSIIYREVDRLANQVSTWWSDLGEWWSARAQDVKWWIDAAQDFLQSQITGLGRSLDGLRIAWDNYWRYVVPTLLSIDKWTAFWGGAWQNIADWWAPKFQLVKDQLAAVTDPITTEVNRLAGLLDMIKEFINDPLDYILGKLLKITKSYQELVLKLFDKVMDALWG